jgi:hypothetical protein
MSDKFIVSAKIKRNKENMPSVPNSYSFSR